MGAYLSEPITKKVSSDQVGKNVAFGASSMQGWRISQEDAHNCCIDFDENVSLFAVYDGHGGHEVATYCAKNLPDFIKQTEAYKRGDIKQALIDAFLEFDTTLVGNAVVTVLKELAGTSTSDKKKDGKRESDEEENVKNLCMEATMPLDQLLAKIRHEASLGIADVNKVPWHSIPPPGYLNYKRNATSSSSGAGCSSSSTNETDVSSSSQPCGSTLSSPKKRKNSECPASNEAEQVLDSTTSTINTNASPPVGSTADVELAKSADMPDSSEDINKKVSSPGKITCTESNANEVEVNGAESELIGDADSSKSGGDNVSSSSCTPLENGDAEQQERISSTGKRRIQPITLYHTLLKKATEESEESEEEETTDDENDETFDDVPESSDEDDTEDLDEDESDEDEDEEDVEGDGNINDGDYNEGLVMDTEEPGYDSGCTAVVAILKGNELYVANAGDSRCVLCRDGRAVELSLDHKPEDEPEMERILNAGGKVTADGRVNGGLNLSRALGDHAYKQNHNLSPEEQMISPLPDVRHITIEPATDEFMVLACDGIWNFMSSQDVIKFIRDRLPNNYDNISKICEELFDHCLAPDTCGDGTGCDNMTAIIIRFKSPIETATNSTAAVCSAKRSPVSPSISTDENDCITQESITPCKRLKC